MAEKKPEKIPGKMIVVNKKNFEAIFGMRRRDRIYAVVGRFFQWIYCQWHKRMDQCQRCRLDCSDRREGQTLNLIIKSEAI